MSDANDTKADFPIAVHDDAIDRTAESKLMRKIDLIILPMMFLFYMLSYLDRVNIANASIQGMNAELSLDVDNRYNTATLVCCLRLF